MVLMTYKMPDDITKIKNRVGAIKLRFAEADKEAKKAAFDKFIEEGGNKDEYEGGDDSVAEAYRKIYSVYRERRQKHIDEVEAAKKHNLEQKQQILEEEKECLKKNDLVFRPGNMADASLADSRQKR